MRANSVDTSYVNVTDMKSSSVDVSSVDASSVESTLENASSVNVTDVTGLLLDWRELCTRLWNRLLCRIRRI